MRKVGYFSMNICVDVYTELFHTEKDCSYTLMNVPFQKAIYGKDHDKLFCFRINHSLTLGIKMIQGLSFIFSSVCLTHSQQFHKLENSQLQTVNLSSYSNKMLFGHLKSSYKRKKAMSK